MNPKLCRFVFILLAGAAFSIPRITYADDADAAVQKALKDAKEAAAKAGVALPDMKDSDDEEAPKKPAGPVVTAPLKALPSWIPAIVGFTAKPNAEKKTQDGIESGAMTGTSTSTPEAIADAIHEGVKGKLSYSQTNSNINGNIVLTVNIAEMIQNGREAEIELKPGKPTTVAITYKMPATPATTPTPTPAK